MINKNITLGKINRLRIDRVTEPGLYLKSENEEDAVLLPNQYITKDMRVDSEIDVFIYTDSEDRLVATTQTPKAYLDEFAFLEVVDTVKFGAFLDIGLQKDILLPKNKQKMPCDVGDKRVVKIVKDEETNRLIATQKFILSKDTKRFSKNEEVKVLVFGKTDLGYKVIVNNMYEGLIFANEVFEKIEIGDIKPAFIKNIREDGKLDISLQLIGKGSDEAAKNKVLEKLFEHGYLSVNSKSGADDIKDIFGLSKKAFKKALNALKEENKISVADDGIRIIK